MCGDDADTQSGEIYYLHLSRRPTWEHESAATETTQAERVRTCIIRGNLLNFRLVSIKGDTPVENSRDVLRAQLDSYQRVRCLNASDFCVFRSVI